MSTKTIISLVSLVIIFSSISSSHAQTLRENMLRAHNNARAQVGVGPVTWDDGIARVALNYANSRAGSCDLVHSGNSKYGENLAWGGGDFTSTVAVNLWVDEKKYYDHNSNTCSAPPGQSCGHYTQVVWRNSVRIGCARVRCNNGNWFVICNYSPPGNYGGQKPY